MQARYVILAPAMLIIAGAADPGRIAAWERASAYICRAEKMRVCQDQSTQCSMEVGQAVSKIDFKAGTYSPFGSDAKYVEHIVFKKFRVHLEPIPDEHFIDLDGGNRSLAFGQPKDTPLQHGVTPAIFTDLSGSDIITYFMWCQPD